MKILYISKIFLGFKQSLEKKNWEPTGVPTIFKIIDYLDKNKEFDLDLMFLNDENILSNKKYKKFDNISLKQFNSKIVLINMLFQINKRYKLLNKLIKPINFLFYLLIILIYTQRTRPDLIYIHKSNLHLAASLSRLTNFPVFFRIMGIFPPMIKILNEKNLRSLITKFSFRSPFRFVLNTEDGSPNSYFMNKAISKNTKHASWINGINIDKNKHDYFEKTLPADKFKVLFLGRLEAYKGILEFVNYMLELLEKNNDQYHIIVIGDGPLEGKIKSIVTKRKKNKEFTFLKNIPHHMISNIFKNIQVYVSLNRYGNLSNANIEAMCSGSCIIMPESDKLTGKDKFLDDIFNKDSIIRIPENTDEKEFIVNQITKLKRDKAELNLRKRNTKFLAEQTFQSWELRIKKEIDLIKKIIKNENIQF